MTYGEDNRFLANPALRTEPLDVLKYKPLFIAGAALGAACFAAVGLKALALPVAVSLLALAMGFGVKHDVTN